MTIRMSDMQSGQHGRVVDLTTDGGLRERLVDLGLIPGTVIERLMSSPVGDPVCYRIRGAMIAIRSCDADRITVGV